ncbi:hypothetical protein M404DRAFT_35237 [Pisolithus tinctorius Marx 270]|uniref:Uncharacterized protein n=1 Tax=Pisolithus tinctorius Marx 270 TaxID=870435 RepID=A0A0C3IB16_PISTI|nr:hypothetical protein M404DRAFT_35237 [Pisolithus tinctorius Marx 270]
MSGLGQSQPSTPSLFPIGTWLQQFCVQSPPSAFATPALEPWTPFSASDHPRPALPWP